MPVLLDGLSGQSAEVAFACAVRAALHDERLDPRVAVTACFAEPGALHERLEHVVGIVEKLLALRSEDSDSTDAAAGTEIKAHRIDRIVVFGDNEDAPHAAGAAGQNPTVRIPEQASIHDWTVQFRKAWTFDDAWRQRRRHVRRACRFQQLP